MEARGCKTLAHLNAATMEVPTRSKLKSTTASVSCGASVWRHVSASTSHSRTVLSTEAEANKPSTYGWNCSRVMGCVCSDSVPRRASAGAFSTSQILTLLSPLPDTRMFSMLGQKASAVTAFLWPANTCGVAGSLPTELGPQTHMEGAMTDNRHNRGGQRAYARGHTKKGPPEPVTGSAK